MGKTASTGLFNRGELQHRSGQCRLLQHRRSLNVRFNTGGQPGHRQHRLVQYTPTPACSTPQRQHRRVSNSGSFNNGALVTTTGRFSFSIDIAGSTPLDLNETPTWAPSIEQIDPRHVAVRRPRNRRDRTFTILQVVDVPAIPLDPRIDLTWIPSSCARHHNSHTDENHSAGTSSPHPVTMTLPLISMRFEGEGLDEAAHEKRTKTRCA